MSDAPAINLTKRLVEQMTAIRDARGGFLRFRFGPSDEIQPRDMFKEGRAQGLIGWREWLYRDGDCWWDATLTDQGIAALKAFEGTPTAPPTRRGHKENE